MAVVKNAIGMQEEASCDHWSRSRATVDAAANGRSADLSSVESAADGEMPDADYFFNFAREALDADEHAAIITRVVQSNCKCVSCRM